MNLSPIVSQLPIMANAAMHTIAISSASYLFGLVIGCIVCLARLSRSALLRGFGRAYISFFRGVPLIVQLLLIYYILPHAGLNVEPLTAAIVGLSFCTAAYLAEILRSGLSAIPKGQRDAAESLGIPSWTIRWRIEGPQMIRIAWPALVNDLILLIKASSLISVVGVFELTRASQNIAAATFQPIPAYVVAAAFYFAIILAITGAARRAERRFGRWAPGVRL